MGGRSRGGAADPPCSCSSLSGATGCRGGTPKETKAEEQPGARGVTARRVGCPLSPAGDLSTREGPSVSSREPLAPMPLKQRSLWRLPSPLYLSVPSPVKRVTAVPARAVGTAYGVGMECGPKPGRSRELSKQLQPLLLQ